MIFKNREPPRGSVLENKLITTITEVFMYEEYLEKLKEEGIIRNRKEGTIGTYTANVNKFLNWTNKNPEELTLDNCRNYIWDLRVNCKFSTQHCNGVNSARKFFFQYVLRKSWDQDIVPRMINDMSVRKPFTGVRIVANVLTRVIASKVVTAKHH